MFRGSNSIVCPSLAPLLTELEDEQDISEVRRACRDLAECRLYEPELGQGVMVVLVRRNGDVIHPQGSTVLQTGDHLALMRGVEAVRELVQRCGWQTAAALQ